jgi:hypothetical protein
MAAASTSAVPAWSVRGHVILACNCDYGCPCNFNALPSTGKCEGNWNWHITDGTFGDVSLSGLTFGVAVNWPHAIHNGDGDGIVVIDERANAAQREALQTLISGKAGGPWKIISSTISKVSGPHYVPFAVNFDGYHSSVSAGDLIALQMEPVRNPVTNAETHPRAVLPEGMVFKDGMLAASSTFRVSGPVSFEHSGKYAAAAEFEYRGP